MDKKTLASLAAARAKGARPVAYVECARRRRSIVGYCIRAEWTLNGARYGTLLHTFFFKDCEKSGITGVGAECEPYQVALYLANEYRDDFNNGVV